VNVPKHALNPGPDTAAVLAHMSMLQATISRLASNSASCKTWCSGLVVALWSLSAVKAPQLLPLSIVPVLALGFLDAAYLAQERKFRAHFEAIAAKVRDRSYEHGDLFTVGEPVSRAMLARATLSWSILPYYGGVAVACVLAWRTVA